MRISCNVRQWLGPIEFLGCAGILAAWLLGAPAQAQSDIWNGYAGSSQVQLNFAPSAGTNGLHLLGAAISEGSQGLSNTIQISQSNGNAWTVDTGSEGMVITADYLEKEFGINALSFNKPSTQQIEYTSDDETYVGFYQNLNVGLYSSDAAGNGTLAATSGQMPVFIATSLINANNVTTSFTGCLPNCSIVAGSLEQMGVGFGRGYPNNYPLAAGAPLQQQTDPLINLTSVSNGNLATMAPGYVISSAGIELGLTSADLQNTDAEKLLVVPYPGSGGGSSYQAAATANEWQTPAMTLVVSNANVSGTYYGSVLVDTGLTNIELKTGATQPPGFQYDAADPAASSALQVYLPGMASGTGQPLSYTLLFQGDCPGGVEDTCPPYQNPSVGLSPIYPSNSHNQTTTGIDYVGSSTPSPAFMNTGGNFLNYFNIVYDPVGGFFGYQIAANPITSQSNPALNTGIALQGAVNIPDGTTVSVPVFLFEEFAQDDSPLANVQLSSPGAVTVTSDISSALYCTGGYCSATGLEVAGGAFTLAGQNSYLGATVVDPGASVALTGDGSIGNSAGLTDNGAFDIAASAGAAIASLAGDGTIALGAQTLTVFHSDDSFTGSISGSGHVTISGGVQGLLGSSSYSGGTTITGGAGVITGSATALGTPQSPLTLYDGTLLLQQSGLVTGPLTVGSGGGAIYSNGNMAIVNGPAMIDGPFAQNGALVVLGRPVIGNGATTIDGELFAPSLTVASGASLGGNGLIAAPTIVAGTLAPGDDPGTLTFAAPVTLQPGATSIFDIDGTGTGNGAGNYSRVIVLPPATYTAGGQLQPLLRGISGSATNSFSPRLGQRFDIVSAGGVFGSYSGLTQPAGLAAGTRFDVLYSPTAIELVTTPAAYAGFTQAAIPTDLNAKSIAQALDAGRPIPGAPMTAQQAALYAPLYPLGAAQLPVALNQLSPQIAADSLLVDRNGWMLANSSIENELQAERGLAAGGQNQSTKLPSGKTLWFSGIGQTANLDADQAPGFNGSLSGFIAGADFPVLPALTAGLAVGYENTSANTATSGNLSGDGVQLAAYADFRRGKAFLDGQLGGSLYEAGTHQTLAAAGSAAAGHNTGNAVGGAITGGFDLACGAWRVEPSLGFMTAEFHQNATTETTGALGLTAGASSLYSAQTLLGVALQRAIPLGSLNLVPDLRIGWDHEYAQNRASLTGGFAAIPGQGFSVDTALLGRDAAELGAGATLATSRLVSLFASYTGFISGSGNMQDFSGGVRIAF